jgi:hypothetical protein
MKTGKNMTRNDRGCRGLSWSLGLVLIGSLQIIAADEVPGWFKAGSRPMDYEMGADRTVVMTGKASGFIRNKPDPHPDGFGTYMQMFEATEYRGKRVRFSAFVKTENVENWASLWMRVDGNERRSIAFDNMQKRQIKGTQNWTRHSIVLDVDAAKSTAIAFGVMLSGKGAVWIDDVRFEVVGQDVPVTDMFLEQPKGPQNLNFDRAETKKQ